MKSESAFEEEPRKSTDKSVKFDNQAVDIDYETSHLLASNLDVIALQRVNNVILEENETFEDEDEDEYGDYGIQEEDNEDS